MMKHAWTALMLFLLAGVAHAQEAAPKGIDEKINDFLAPISKAASDVVFFSLPVFGTDKPSVPLVLILLVFTAIFLTIYFKFINLRSFKIALRTLRGKYSDPSDPGQITHFQALSTAVSATVGLGNIAGVAIAIGLGGPGAVFWMIFMGLMGMTSKFTECTLGVKYRITKANGEVSGGGMYYLRDGLKERGLGMIGLVLSGFFAIACIGGAVGAGNMFQVNQAYSQISDTFGIFNGANGGVYFGVIMAVLVGLVILGGIVSIARVTSYLVPFMCVTYVIACIVVLACHIPQIPGAVGTIVSEAFTGTALGGGFIGALIQGIKRGVFSNEAGVGSAAIAHGAVKTKKPASEGIVALLEPFIDTVIVCSMTALVIVVTGIYKVDASVNSDVVLSNTPALEQAADAQLTSESRVKILEKADDASWFKVRLEDGETEGYLAATDLTERSGTAGGIWMTSEAFASVISWFPYVLAIAVFLFAFSTMISWSYYGEQAVLYLTKGSEMATKVYKVVFCLFVVVGASASLGNVIDLSDAMFFAMVVPNLIGLYLLLPVVKKELQLFLDHAKEIDGKE